MSETQETPQQRQARIRQQKREAKIKGAAQDRLDKITQVSGRTPELMRNESPVGTPPTVHTPTPARTADAAALPSASIFGQSNDPEQARLQEEYMRVLLGGQQQTQDGQTQQQGAVNEDDPMIKMMQTMLGGLSGDPNAPATGEMPFSADDISKMTGMPSFLTSMFMGGKQQAPPTPHQVSSERRWKIIRTIAAVLIGIYTVFTVDSSILTFGQHPPAPATAQNPFVVFLTSQLLLNGARIALSATPAGQSGFKSYIRTGRDIAADGAILVFILGVYSWVKGYA